MIQFLHTFLGIFLGATATVFLLFLRSVPPAFSCASTIWASTSINELSYY